MAVVMLALGSRGDVQPLATLAGALGRRGVRVRIVALAEYAGLLSTEAPDAAVVPVRAGLDRAIRRGARRDAWLARSSAGQLALLQRWTAGMASEVVGAALSAAEPGDVVVSGVLTRGLADALAQARGCRVATIVYTGQVPTLERESHFYGTWITGWRPYDTWGVRLGWSLSGTAGGALTRVARARLGLPRAGFRRVSADADRHPTIVAASPVLVPTASDWAGGVHQTGYLGSPERPFTPDAPLAEFLDGEPAVYVGFGSFTRFATRADFDLVVEAAARAGRRVITPALPGMTPGPVGGGVFAVGAIPHRWLFPRVAATIHHGGSGTAHEALLGGVPSASVPFGFDQPYHGRRLHRLGIGPAPLPVSRLTPDRLAALIRDLVDSPDAVGYERRAAELGDRVRHEDGVARTVDLLDRLGYLA